MDSLVDNYVGGGGIIRKRCRCFAGTPPYYKEDAYYETTQPYPVSGPCGHDALTLLTGCGGGKVTERAMERPTEIISGAR